MIDVRILLITDEEWNDVVYGNNVLTNWFNGFDAEFAQIYCSPGLPYNEICHHYFQITDAQMVQSLLGKGRAGQTIMVPTEPKDIEASKENVQRKGAYSKLKQLSLYIHTPMMMIRDFIWMWGKYDEVKLKKFIDNFSPDLVFCPRLITPKLMRLEKKVSKMTNAPFVAFTADNEASYKHYTWSPLFWIRCWMINRMFQKHVSLYKHYFMFSEAQAKEYHQKYGLSTSCLYKSGKFEEKNYLKNVGAPIRMIYAGRLYCNRWKTLASIGEALTIINAKEKKIYLDIYTTERLTLKQRKALNHDSFIYVHPPIAPDLLREEYRKADIALHVESFDKANRYATIYSFSTKIIDLMASTCAIIAICWERHTGLQYLKEKDAAICVSSSKNILSTLENITATPSLINVYAEKAWNCGTRYHNQKFIQSQIRNVFNHVIGHNKN